ncbi:amino acid adenylation domain-containing protein [Streptomyces misionensis]|uniref:Amino acid adenylation domain-containing protein n=1 Tax=Streptomyces misionensis TaxID=67331 RepID=A0A5C6JW15_9ACTN|nr:non-ribosomal peptide synthetase [Streptomyces misionensis]TWV53482.1 amino acid adenylation domain-containing protein [Streptomyces misionensis]
MSLTRLLADLAAAGVRLSLDGDRLLAAARGGGIPEELRQEVRSRRAEITEFLREQREEEARRGVRIEPADRGTPLPASYAQQRLWLVEQLGTDLPVYNMYFAYDLEGPVDAAALCAAAEEVMRRHEVLRTALVETDDGLVQSVSPVCPANFRIHDVTDGGHDALLFEIVSTRFDLSKAPLIRFDLLRKSPQSWTFVLTQHHVISDGWSAGLLRKELSELYTARLENRPARLPDVTVHYADYAVWERSWLGGEMAEQQRSYWKRTLADLPAPLELVPGRKRSTVQSFHGSELLFRLGADTVAAAGRLGSETRSTMYATLVAAFSLLLSRMSRTDDITVGSPLANRAYPALERTLGLFFNSIAIRTRIDPDESVRDYVGRCRRTVLDAFAHQDLPFDQVVSVAAPERSTSHSPVFQSLFIFQSYPDVELELPGVKARQADCPIYSAQYDLMFKVQPDTEGLQGQLIFNDTLISREDAERFVALYERLVTTMSEHADSTVGSLELADPADARRIESWNAAARVPVPERSVHDEIRQALAADPQRLAVAFRGRQVSRGELTATAERVAAGLREADLRPGQRVGVLVPRSPDLLAVVLGILHAGLVYVPLDGRSPQHRLTAMLDRADCAAVVTAGPYADHCRGSAALRLRAEELLDSGASAVDPHIPAPDDAAYVIFTSGSTGQPKGVEVSHGNLTNLFVALDRAVPLPDDPVWAAVTAATFDISVLELLWTMARGVPVVLAETSETLVLGGADASRTLPELILASGANALQATPTLLRSVLRLPNAEQALSRLRLLLVGGEALDATLARRLKDLGIPTVLNMYGPTETTVWSTCWRLPDAPEPVRIGQPLANNDVYVVDNRLAPLPIGVYGELVIGGAGVAHGYVGRPELTAERFVTLPGTPGTRVYRTGDMGRWLPDGALEVVGRIDNQVKVNGHRVELEEVEQALNSLPGIADCAVGVQRTPSGSALVAHCVLTPGGSLNEAALIAGLGRTLPGALIPMAFAATPELPTTTGGKVDRRALPEIPLAAPTRSAPEPEGALETGLLAVWREVLADPAVGPEDDFFQAGGNSILVARLLSAVRRELVPDARIVDLFRHPTVRRYAAHVTRPGQTGENPGLPGDRPATEANERIDARRLAQQQRREQVRRKKEIAAARQQRPAHPRESDGA